jgi:anti-sigma-K factor RskA
MSDGHRSDRLEELLPAAALGALDADERRELEALLAAGGDAARRDEEWRATSALIAADLAVAIEPAQPSEIVRARLLREIGAQGKPPERAEAPPRPVANPWPLRLVAAATLLVALWAGAAQWRLRGALDDLGAMDRQLAEARRQLQETVWAQRVVASPEVRPIVLAGLGPLPDARARTFVDPLDRRAVFYAYNLPPADAGRIYQLWFIASGVPVSAGLFDADPGGRAHLHVENVAALESIQAWAVTVEPAGGVPQPTGPMVLKS